MRAGFLLSLGALQEPSGQGLPFQACFIGEFLTRNRLGFSGSLKAPLYFGYFQKSPFLLETLYIHLRLFDMIMVSEPHDSQVVSRDVNKYLIF